ncbi:unnamed protein product [Cunninghamella echinulata]
MSTENITVSLSRLALAKAIKTPDAGEEKEPWSKSIIFHESHISPEMLDSVVYPHQQQQRRKNGRPHYHKQQQQQQQRPPTSAQQDYHRQHRQSRQLLNQTPPMNRRHNSSTPMQQQQQQEYIPRPVSSYGLNSGTPSSSSSNKSIPLGHPQQQPIEERQKHKSASPVNNRQRKERVQYVPSDDDEEEEEEEEEEDSEDELKVIYPKSSTPNPYKTQSTPKLNNINNSNPSFTNLQTPSTDNLNEKKKKVPVASDGESEDEEDQDNDDDDDDDSEDENETSETMERKKGSNREGWSIPLGASIKMKQNEEEEMDDHTRARRMSTLRQLERGPSVHKRSRSVGAMEKLYAADVNLDNETNNNTLQSPIEAGDGIEDWRQTVLNAVDSIGMDPNTTATSPSPTPYLDTQKPSSSAIPSIHSDNNNNINNNNNNNNNNNTQTPPSTRGRRTTLGEMDMMYFMQQQQVQMLQQQQMAQMQYQQAVWQAAAQQQMLQQQMMIMPMEQQQQMMMLPMEQQQDSRRSKVKSVSAMDLMLQIEQEKESKVKRKQKKIDPSKARIDGLLGQVKEQGTHNISFQHQQQAVKERAGRSTPRNDFYLQQQHQSRQSMMMLDNNNNNILRSQTPSSMMMMNNNQPQSQQRRRTQMFRSESSPGIHNQMYQQSMGLHSTPGLVTSASTNNLSNLLPSPAMAPSKSTGRPTSTMRPQSAYWGN